MIRPFRHETLRYGEPSRIEESMWDHPFQWGSRRAGPDLARVGNFHGGDKYPNLWHYEHMLDPRKISPGSNMPAYPWLLTERVDLDGTPRKLAVMRKLGVPYTDAHIANAVADYRRQADAIVQDLARSGITIHAESELVALIAYLQRLGDNELVTKVAQAK
jgi:cytochrome c oxidase cbb3-type subunit I/II